MIRPMAAAEPVPEKIGIYRVIRPLAVSRAVDSYLGSADGALGFQRLCVLRRARTTIDADAQLAEELAHEASVCARLSHAAIVRMYDLIDHDRRLVFVFEHVDGVDLGQLIQHLARRGERLSDDAIGYLGLELAGAAAHAHASVDTSGDMAPVIHRDLCPENLLIAWDGQVRVAGFGLGKLVGAKGAPGYMAPEQTSGGRVTPRADVYSVAAILWSLFTGRRPPAEGAPLESLSKLRSDLPRELVAAITAALESSIAARRITCLEFEQWFTKSADLEAGRAELREKAELLRPAPGKPAEAPEPGVSTAVASVAKAASLAMPPAPAPPRGPPPLPARALPPAPAAPRAAGAPPRPPPLPAAARAHASPPAEKDHEILEVQSVRDDSMPFALADLRGISGLIPEEQAAVQDAPSPGVRDAPSPVVRDAPASAGWLDVGDEVGAGAPAVVVAPRAGASEPFEAKPRPLSALQSVGLAATMAILVVTGGIYVVERLMKPPAALSAVGATATAGAPSAAAASPSVTIAAVKPPLPVLAATASSTASAAATASAASTASADSAASAALTASAAPAVSAAPTASATSAAGPVSATGAPSTPSVGALPAGFGYLTVRSEVSAHVFVTGEQVGLVNEANKIPCGRWFVRIGTPDPKKRFTKWLGPGATVEVACKGTTTVELKPWPAPDAPRAPARP